MYQRGNFARVHSRRILMSVRKALPVPGSRLNQANRLTDGQIVLPAADEPDECGKEKQEI